MHRPSRIAVLILWLALGVLPARVQAGEAVWGPGSKIEALTVGPVTYQQVQVRSVNARTVLITHAGGMTSLRLRELSPDWQARFRYDPAAEAAVDEAVKADPPPVPVVRRPKPTPLKGASKFDALLQKFGQPARLQAEVDLRPKYFQLELGVKNQGQRPSCAVFAIVSALEFQNAELTGKVDKLSEEYLIWAARKSVQRLPSVAKSSSVDPSAEAYQDEGFSLTEVVAALRAYGIPLQASMPNTFGRRIEAIEDPPPAIVQEARTHQRVFVHQLPGRDNPTRLNNIIHALNAGQPVAVGMNWPLTRVVNGYLSTHKAAPDRGHAVTLVGYKSATGRIEDTYFVFKNSWGPTWGQGGYGTVTAGYLNSYLHEAVLLEVLAGGS